MFLLGDTTQPPAESLHFQYLLPTLVCGHTADSSTAAPVKTRQPNSVTSQSCWLLRASLLDLEGSCSFPNFNPKYSTKPFPCPQRRLDSWPWRGFWVEKASASLLQAFVSSRLVECCTGAPNWTPGAKLGLTFCWRVLLSHPACPRLLSAAGPHAASLRHISIPWQHLWGLAWAIWLVNLLLPSLELPVGGIPPHRLLVLGVFIQ